MKNSHTDKLIYFMMGIGSGIILSGILMLAIILNTKEIYDYKDNSSIKISSDSAEIDKEKQINANTSNEQLTSETTDYQLNGEMINNQEVISTTNNQETTKAHNEQVTTKAHNERATTRVTDKQVTTKAHNEQTTTKVTEEQTTTKVNNEQATTKAADELVTTKETDEQMTTKSTEETVTTEATTEQETRQIESIQINNIKSDQSLGSAQNMLAAKEVIKINIPKNLGASQICKILQENGVIDNSKQFKEYIVKEGKTTKLRSGDFFFTKDLEYDEVLDILTRKKY